MKELVAVKKQVKLLRIIEQNEKLNLSGMLFNTHFVLDIVNLNQLSSL